MCDGSIQCARPLIHTPTYLLIDPQVEYDAECGGLDRSVARTVLTPGALTFVAELVHEFRDGVAEVSRRCGDGPEHSRRRG